MTPVHRLGYHQRPHICKGDTIMAANNTDQPKKKTDSFREKLGDKDLEIDDYKVDDLRKIASEYDISGSHDLNKEALVNAINQVRRGEDQTQNM
jgi:hypothetical protein